MKKNILGIITVTTILTCIVAAKGANRSSSLLDNRQLVYGGETTQNLDGDIVIIETSYHEEDTSERDLFEDFTLESTSEETSGESSQTTTYGTPQSTTVANETSQTTTGTSGNNSTSVNETTTSKNDTVVKPYKKKKIGWKKENGRKYYYVNGVKVKGWKKIKGKYYFFKTTGARKGSLMTNSIVGTKKGGYYYVDKKGVRVKDATIKKAVSLVRKNTKASWKNEKKLKAAFDYIVKNYTPEDVKGTPNKKTLKKYANNMFNKNAGNSYSCAAVVAYVAKTLGYDSRVVVGRITCTEGVVPHGWAEVKIDGQWYIFDADMQSKYPQLNCFKQTKKSFAFKHRAIKRYKIYVNNGKVSWK